MDDREILARADANYFRSWSMLTAGTPGHEIVEQDGLLMTSGRHDYAAFNLAYLWKSARPLEERLAALGEYFSQRRCQHSVRFRVGALRGVERALEQAGFELAEEADIPALVHTGLAGIPDGGPLRVVTCRTKAELAAWARTMAAGYSVPEALARLFTAPVTAGAIGYELYLGYADRRPVATSGMVLNNGVAGVYMVSTVPGERRQGYGEQLTRHAMCRGRELGALFASLQSSVMGLPVYRRLGFHDAGSYRTYRPKLAIV